MQAPGLVLEIGHHPIALTRPELVQPVRGFLQLALLAAGNNHLGAVLHERLRGHLAETRRTASDQHDVRTEVKERRNREVRGGCGVRHDFLC